MAIAPADIRRIITPAAPITRERMRADIARMLHEDPEAIGGEDSLMDLGLDSMRAMNLVLAWSEGGLELEFAEFAETPTLDGWWALIRTRQAARGV
ncbi:phosphopantetheine-binding protein [Ancylobacter amanitiformis]|uniref:Bifunctional isochorismate lyase/aryl carrier protein n=1 Tax=Ancylobacter amanitiformis TaxID=217069 RepID=A0ABU0LS00_9HYPH|nr:phosphopantetheine-binding protein [Ancylobacter amanitiformis]MDQ0511454.1 bifunctional isochorismate lyase/aryl carrier protein [Ancylobacter amanitiformis]